MNAATRTAATAYQENAAAVSALLRELAALVDAHAADQAAAPANWGDVGDVAHVREQLADLVALLGDRS